MCGCFFFVSLGRELPRASERASGRAGGLLIHSVRCFPRCVQSIPCLDRQRLEILTDDMIRGRGSREKVLNPQDVAGKRQALACSFCFVC